MKKLLCFTLVVLALLTAFAACGNSDETTAKNTTESPNVTTTPVETTVNPSETTTAKTPDETTVKTPDETTVKTPDETTAEAPEDTTEPVETDSTTAKTPEDTTEQTPEPETPTGKNLLEGDILGALGIEDHHGSTDYHPTLVFYIYGDATTYTDMRGNEFTDADAFVNSKYTWKLTVNGKTFTPAKMSIFDGGDWGYFRADLGAADTYDAVNGIITFTISLRIVDTATNEVAYYADFPNLVYSVTGIFADESKPEGLTAVSGVTGVSGPNAGGDEGFEKLFDNNGKTKLCTDDNSTPIIANLGGAKTLKGISLVNANDNAGSTGRTVIAFEVWVSENGTDWGTAAAFATTGEGVNKADVSANYQERYYGFDTAITATYVKLVINNGEMYQMSEVIFFE